MQCIDQSHTGLSQGKKYEAKISGGNPVLFWIAVLSIQLGNAHRIFWRPPDEASAHPMPISIWTPTEDLPTPTGGRYRPGWRPL